MKRYVLAGASSRGIYMFAKPLAFDYKDTAQLAGVFDINRVRAEFASKECGGIPVFDDFDRMLKETKPDVVIVATIDRYHHEYIIKALEADCDVISEKPMTINAAYCKAILEAERRTGRKVTVTFNCRFIPYVERVKELIKEGAVGQILSVDFEWLLDTSHGADYFRRWHRYLDNCGGLLVHKSTHHFDMINWWLEEDPEEVYAFGTRRFYGPTREKRGERCLTCPHKGSCEFYWDIRSDDMTRQLYLEAEKEDGYYRDRCVFADDIDIYDSMSVNVRYSGNCLLTYSLIAHSPYEGWKVAINGTEGRLEAEEFGSGMRAGEDKRQIRLYNRKGEMLTYDIKKADGVHGGGDERLRKMLFGGGIEDTLGRQADSYAGAMSILIGAASNISIAEKVPVSIKNLLK